MIKDSKEARSFTTPYVDYGLKGGEEVDIASAQGFHFNDATGLRPIIRRITVEKEYSKIILFKLEVGRLSDNYSYVESLSKQALYCGIAHFKLK